MKPDFARRRKKLWQLMRDKGMDSVFTSDPSNVFYYTGYAGMKDDRVFMIAPLGAKPKILVSSLENDASSKYANVGYLRDRDDFIKHLKKFECVGYDERSLSLMLFRLIRRQLKTKLLPAGGLLEMPRIEKDAFEIAKIREAIEITRKALARTAASLAGKTEKQVSDGMEIEYRKFGASESFETIVCSGTHSSFIHHKPDHTITKANAIMLIDTGCVLDGYCTDITRTFFGKLDSRQRRIYEDVKAIHDELIAYVIPGVEYKDLEDLQKELFSRNGYKVMHGLGHGIGLNVHESTGKVIKENVVMTVEPGVYVKGQYGFRVEDMILVKKNGAEILSGSIPIL
jgi:Xaa-Pro dipeptidase